MDHFWQIAPVSERLVVEQAMIFHRTLAPAAHLPRTQVPGSAGVETEPLSAGAGVGRLYALSALCVTVYFCHGG